VSGLLASKAPHEAPDADEPSESERQLLDYLIERAWEACLRALRENRPTLTLDRSKQEP
jgi:hypothetical protein